MIHVRPTSVECDLTVVVSLASSSGISPRDATDTARPRPQPNGFVLVLPLVVVLSEEFEGEDDDEDVESLPPDKKLAVSSAEERLHALCPL
jgi:hypothetical protein